MYLVVRKDIDLLTGQLVNLFVERVVEGSAKDARDVLNSIVDNIVVSYKRLGIKYDVKDYIDGTYIKAEVCMVILFTHEVTNGSMPLYHHEVSHDDDYVLNDAAKAISNLAHTTLDNAKGILSCFGYEIDGKPFMLADRPVDGEKQVGMDPDDFKEKYASVLYDDAPDDQDTVKDIMVCVNKVCYKHHVDTKPVYDAITVGGKTLSEWSKEGVL